MGVSSRGGLFDYLARLHRPPVVDSDADLLGRFARGADELAYSGIVRRHGPMVLAVCRRRLGHEADAEDAFQAVFLALARSAASIGRRESLAGWLYRVAYRVSLKAAGRRSRRADVAHLATEVPMSNLETPAWEIAELKAAIDAELDALPDRFRSVVVLCLVEGRTNAEAATVLGVPVGTVDSRLNTARTKLRGALTRRGVALGLATSLDPLLGGWARAAEGPAFEELTSITIRAVLAEAAGPGTGAVSPAVADLARGVTTMTTNLRLAVALMVALGILGGAGAGLYVAVAADPPGNSGSADSRNPGPAAGAESGTQQVPKTGSLEADAVPKAASLDRLFGKQVGGADIPAGELLSQIEDLTDLVVRVDVAAFRRVGALDDFDRDAKQFLTAVNESSVILPRKADKLPIRDVLADTLAQVRITHPCTYQVRGSQLVIVPAYMPPARPGADPLVPDDEPPVIEMRLLYEQVHGGVVAVSAERKSLKEIVADLRKQTGANIVIDLRCEDQADQAALTVTLNDVRLYDALRVIADMAELKMVYAGNIYYVTTRQNAAAFQPSAPAPAPPTVLPTNPPTPGK